MRRGALGAGAGLSLVPVCRRPLPAWSGSTTRAEAAETAAADARPPVLSSRGDNVDDTSNDIVRGKALPLWITPIRVPPGGQRSRARDKDEPAC